MKKKVVILGSTGSVGLETYNIIKKNKKNFFIELLSTNTNYKKILLQAKYLKVKNIIINDFKSYQKAIKINNNKKLIIHNNFSVINKLFKKNEIFYSMISIVGIDGLEPTLKMIEYSNYIAIANKESLICGWNLIKKKMNQFGTKFIPVDSEHFSIYSLTNNSDLKFADKIYITASGGPFLDYNFTDLSKITIKQALNHPNWSMGKKISIDSATMMNKLFEVIETKKIFNIPYNKIKILIHPKSYIHAIVKFKNGLTKILLHEPNMKIPIHNSIYINDYKNLKSKKLNLEILNNPKFQFVDYKKFPLLKLLKELPKNDSLFETILISINDYFVSAFLKKKINYTRLIYLIDHYARKKIFQKFKRISPEKSSDIHNTVKFVSEILNKSGI